MDARAEAPRIHSQLDEYCRRLRLTKPALATIDTKAVNLALFGFSRQASTLAITKGALDTLKDEELSALIAREIHPG